MKPLLIRSNQTLHPKLEIETIMSSYFHYPWHFHPELELTLVIKSYGQRQIGDSIENFYPGDLVLVGSNLPHVWKNDQSFLHHKEEKNARAIVVKFTTDFVGQDLLNLPEMKIVKDLIFEKAGFGIKLLGDLRASIENEMRLLSQFSEGELLLKVIQMLLKIATSGEYKMLASNLYKTEKSKSNHRVNRVLDYIMENYHRNLTLEELAGIIYMNKNAFCQFFKKSTGNTLFTVINRIRIAKSCQELIETDKSVLRISLDVGYTSLSNFNRNFKRITTTSPLNYRKKHL